MSKSNNVKIIKQLQKEMGAAEGAAQKKYLQNTNDPLLNSIKMLANRGMLSKEDNLKLREGKMSRDEAINLWNNLSVKKMQEDQNNFKSKIEQMAEQARKLNNG